MQHNTYNSVAMKKNNTNWYILRWQILQRDLFTCQYCGQKAPDVILHVDHKEAYTNGGSNDPSNLITACSACNIGKGLTPFRPGAEPTAMLSPFKPKLGHLSEQRLVEWIQNNGPMTATELAKAIGFNRANIASLLSTSERFRKVRKVGKSVYYSLTPTESICDLTPK